MLLYCKSDNNECNDEPIEPEVLPPDYKLDLSPDQEVKSISASKFSPYAPPTHEAKVMDDRVFRNYLRKSWDDAAEQRKKDQNGAVGSRISDQYLDALNGGNNNNKPVSNGKNKFSPFKKPEPPPPSTYVEPED